jgi:hypothetical protein
MNTLRRSLLSALPIALCLVLGGCASDGSDDAAPGAESEMVAAPITLDNWLAHPKIKAIRKEVTAIEASTLTEAVNPGCDTVAKKYTDPSGRIRKLTRLGGEGFGAFSHTTYVRENGKALFTFMTNHLFEEKTGSEMRIYYDVAGKQIWQVVRSGPITDTNQDLSGQPDRLPAGDEVLDLQGPSDPEADFQATGCPEQP